jgi:hypothetical protein
VRISSSHLHFYFKTDAPTFIHPELGPFLEHKTTVYWAERIQDSAGTPAQRRQAIRVWTWVRTLV